MLNKYNAEIENLQEKLKSLKKKKAEMKKAKYSKIARLLIRRIQDNQNFFDELYMLCQKNDMKDLLAELNNFKQQS